MTKIINIERITIKLVCMNFIITPFAISIMTYEYEYDRLKYEILSTLYILF